MMKNILIHGLGQNSESWDNTSVYLKENNIEGFNVNELYSELLQGNGIKYENILDVFVSNLLKQVKTSMKSVTTLFIVIIIMAVLSSLELDKNSDVIKITKLIVIICISSILLKNYIEIVDMFKNIVNLLGYAMQIVSTFLTGILLASGKITSTGIIQPLLLFVSSFICVITNYIVIPFFTISIVLAALILDSKLGITCSSSNTTILFSAKISETLTFAVTTEIDVSSENFIVI